MGCADTWPRSVFCGICFDPLKQIEQRGSLGVYAVTSFEPGLGVRFLWSKKRPGLALIEIV